MTAHTHSSRWMAITLVAVGAVGAVVCHRWHFCDCGHMAHNPFRVLPLQHAIDYAWASASAVALWLGFRFRLGVVRWLALGLVTLAVYRFFFESQDVRESWGSWLPYMI